MTLLHHHIRDKLPHLSRAERQVGYWLLDNFSNAAGLALGEAACAADVSEPTIVRFCRSLGLSGYRELRTALIAARQHPDSVVHQDVAPGDTGQRAATKVLDNSIRALVDLRSVVENMPFDQAADCINGARQLVFVGLGASGLVAEDARHKFFRLGIPCVAATDPQTIVQQASVMTSEDVLIAISHSGTWPELLQAVERVRQNETVSIAVTSSDSTLGRAVDINFACAAREDTDAFTPMTSRIAQLAVLDALQVAAALRLGSKAETHLRESKDALTHYRQQKNDSSIHKGDSWQN